MGQRIEPLAEDIDVSLVHLAPIGELNRVSGGSLGQEPGRGKSGQANYQNEAGSREWGHGESPLEKERGRGERIGVTLRAAPTRGFIFQ